MIPKMKTFSHYALLFVFFTFSLFSCEPEWVDGPGYGGGTLAPFHFVITPCVSSDSLTIDTLPQITREYLAEVYPEDSIVAVVGYQLTATTTAFGVSLSGDQAVLVNQEGLVVGLTDNMIVNLLVEDLPQATINYLDRELSGWDTLSYNVTLEDSFGSGIIVFSLEAEATGEIIFSQTGEMLCNQLEWFTDEDEEEEDEEEEEEHDCESGYLRVLVQPWLSLNLGLFQIDDIQCDDWCDEEPIITVEVDGSDIEYYFTAEGAFYFSLQTITAAELPEVSLATLNATYPRCTLGEVSLLTYADATVAYDVEVMTAGGDDFEIIIDDLGQILCEDQ